VPWLADKELHHHHHEDDDDGAPYDSDDSGEGMDADANNSVVDPRDLPPLSSDPVRANKNPVRANKNPVRANKNPVRANKNPMRRTVRTNARGFESRHWGIGRTLCMAAYKRQLSLVPLSTAHGLSPGSPPPEQQQQKLPF
jgi:hypothetical protein